MSQSIETTGTDVESAVAEAVAQLGVTPDRVQVEVLEEPVRRLLGLGLRPARVRVTVIASVSGVSGTAAPGQAPSAPSVSPTPAAEPKPASRVEIEPEPTSQAPGRDAVLDVREVDRGIHEDEAADEFPDEAVEILTDEQLDRDAQTAAEVLRKLLGFLGIEGTVTVRHADTDGREARHWLLEIQGNDMAALIGNKGETLAALQYLTRLIVSREVGHHANLILDVAGYKSHREEMLKRLARRMASQAVELKHTVTLEPMPPHERRIVHLTLRDHPSVTTESVGEGDKRKVTIIPRRKS